ncbi:MAG: glycosyltransferase family 39 protein [Byssovorax sp.]
MTPRRGRLALLIAWLTLAFVLAFGVAAYRRSPPPQRSDDEFLIEPRQGDQLGAWMNPSGAAGAWVLLGGNILQNHAVFRYEDPGSGARSTLELHHEGAVPTPLLTTREFALSAANGVAPPELVAALGARLRANESAYRWIEPEQHPTPIWLRRLRQLQLPVAWLLLAQSPLWLLLALHRAIGHLAALPRWARRGVLAAVLVSMVARWVLAPLRLVVLYIGYQLTAHELALQPLPRYGAAVAVFHHVLLRAFAPDHLTILRAHAVIGVLLVPLVAALVQAYARRPGAAVAAALLWGLVPAFIAHDGSEANTVPLLLWLVAGLLLWLDAIDRGSALSLIGSAALLALAAVGRPEFPLLVPAAVLALTLGCGRRSRVSVWAALPLVLAAAVLAIPHLVHVGESAALLSVRDSLPMGRSLLANRVGVLDSSLYPFALVPFAVAAVVLPGSRRAAAALLAVATLGIVLTWVDIDPANILRVQVPGALFYALAVALGVASVATFARRRLAQPRHRAFAVLGVGLVLALSVIPCLKAAFGRTTEDEEESFVREALRALPAGDIQLVRLGYGDIQGSQSGSPVHLYFPDYLFAPAGSGRSVRDLADWEKNPSHPAAYLYLGTRCYTPEHPFSPHTAPDVVPLRDACQEILDHHTSDLVLERTVPTHGDPTQTGFYGAAVGRPMRLALYRLRAGLAAP